MAFRNTSSEEEIVSTLGGQARLAPGADTLFTGPNIADVVRYPVTSETAAEPPSMVSIWSESHLVTAFASGAIRGADPNAVCDFAIQVFVSP